MARGIPDDGQLVSCEYSPEHAAVARTNVDRAGIGRKVDIRVGAALDTLPKLIDQQAFDFVFIDADKENNVNYLEWALRLTRPRRDLIRKRARDIEDPHGRDGVRRERWAASAVRICGSPSAQALSIFTFLKRHFSPSRTRSAS